MVPGNPCEVLRPDPFGVARAAALLREGRLVAFATETVYGLGADAANGAALARLFVAKGRPRFNPLIVHVTDFQAAAGLAEFGPLARDLARKFWPGPLTLVLRRLGGVHSLASAGLDSVAIRVPAHPVARALLAAFGGAVAAPSANRSGRVSPTTAAHVLEDLGDRIEAVLDAGPCPCGIESTVIDARGEVPVLLRPGAVPLEAIEAAFGPVARGGSAALHSPGLLASHYAPVLPLRLEAEGAAADEALLGFGRMPAAGLALNLSASGDLVEAAAALFGHLRALDAEGRRRGLRGIAAMPVPARELGVAINDRLRRAAAPRPSPAGAETLERPAG